MATYYPCIQLSKPILYTFHTCNHPPFYRSFHLSNRLTPLPSITSPAHRAHFYIHSLNYPFMKLSTHFFIQPNHLSIFSFIQPSTPIRGFFNISLYPNVRTSHHQSLLSIFPLIPLSNPLLIFLHIALSNSYPTFQPTVLHPYLPIRQYKSPHFLLFTIPAIHPSTH